jgi:hypothetical protein
MDDSRTIASSFNLGGVYSDTYVYKDFLGIILDTLDVYHTTPVANDDDTEMPLPMAISAYPNPFSNVLSVSAKAEKTVSIKVFNIKGQLVTQTDVTPENGTVNWTWDGKNIDGRTQAAGIYMIKVTQGVRSSVIKTLMLK